jgi:hypothetical protein
MSQRNEELQALAEKHRNNTDLAKALGNDKAQDTDEDTPKDEDAAPAPVAPPMEYDADGNPLS